MIPDEDYAHLARITRDALTALGSILRDCLPGEPAACGFGYRHHYLANLAALIAVATHSVGHVDGAGINSEFTKMLGASLREISANCGGPGHGRGKGNLSWLN